MKKNIVLLIFCVFSITSYSYEVYRSSNYNSKSNQYVGECSSTPQQKFTFKTDKATQSVMLQVSDLYDNSTTDPRFLDGCKVIDDRNWSCESNSQIANYVLYWTSYKVMDGKMYSIPTHKIFNNSVEKILIEGKNQNYCWFNKTIFGYKKQ